MLMTALHTAIAVSSQSIKMDRHHYKAVSNKKDRWSNMKMSSVFISILYSATKKRMFIYI